MAKKGKTIQLQSPENYIRTRARNLEIFECLISPDWKETGIANVVVARKHTNGNITAAIYLVDIFCLGVKDTMYMFNESEHEYREKLKPNEIENPFTKIEYILAHNIIFAAIEFAGDYGFTPHKDFVSVTKYLLEEDTDDIELIDIECGIDGKPAYFQGVDDSKATIARIINQLERTAGRGNYNFTIDDDYNFKPEPKSGISDEDDNEFNNDDEDDDMTYDEAIIIFSKLYKKFDSLKKEEAQSFIEAVEVLFGSLVDGDEFDKYYEEFFDDLDIELDTTEIPDEMLGLPISLIHHPDELKNRLKPILELSEKKYKKGMKLIVELKKDYAGVPLLSFLELHFEQEKVKEVFTERLRRCEEEFPDYPLIKIASLIHSFLKNPDISSESEIIPLRVFFPDRSSIHDFEIQQYLVYALFITLMGSDKSRLAAFYEVLVDLEFPDDFMELFYSLIIAEKIKVVARLTGKAE